MHHSLRTYFKFLVLLVLVTLPSLSQAGAPPELSDFYKESQKERTAAGTEKDFKGKSSHLNNLEKDLKKALAQYKKHAPQEANAKEDKVSEFFYVLDPVLKLAVNQPSLKECSKTRHEIETTDKAGRGEDAQPTDSAKEALEWLDILCY